MSQAEEVSSPMLSSPAIYDDGLNDDNLDDEVMERALQAEAKPVKKEVEPDTTMQELVIPEDTRELVPVTYNEKLEATKYGDAIELNQDRLEQRHVQEFVPGFDVRDINKVPIPTDQQFANAVDELATQQEQQRAHQKTRHAKEINTSLFDFDILQENLNKETELVHDEDPDYIIAAEKMRIAANKKGQELIESRKSLRDKMLLAQRQKQDNVREAELRDAKNLNIKRPQDVHEVGMKEKMMKKQSALLAGNKKITPLNKKKEEGIEIKELVEKYANPEEKKGQPRSHVGNLKYSLKKVGLGNLVISEQLIGQSQLIKMSEEEEVNLNDPLIKEITDKVEAEFGLPDDIKADLTRILRGTTEKPEHAKIEYDYRMEQINLRKMMKTLNDFLTSQIHKYIHIEEREATKKKIMEAKKNHRLPNRPPQEVRKARLDVLTQQVANTERQEELLKIDAFELQAKIKRLQEFPNISETLEESIRDLDRNIHKVEVANHTMEITSKQYKRIGILKQTKEQEKKIVALENQVAAIYDKVYNLEDKFKKDQDKAATNAKQGVVGHLFGRFEEEKDVIVTSQFAQLKQRVRNANELHNQLEGELRLLKMEENTIIFQSDIDRENEKKMAKKLGEAAVGCELKPKEKRYYDKQFEAREQSQKQVIAQKQICFIQQKQFFQKQMLIQKQVQDQNYKKTTLQKKLFLQQQYIGELFAKMGVFIDFNSQGVGFRHNEYQLDSRDILQVKPQLPPVPPSADQKATQGEVPAGEGEGGAGQVGQDEFNLASFRGEKSPEAAGGGPSSPKQQPGEALKQPEQIHEPEKQHPIGRKESLTKTPFLPIGPKPSSLIGKSAEGFAEQVAMPPPQAASPTLMIGGEMSSIPLFSKTTKMEANLEHGLLSSPPNNLGATRGIPSFPLSNTMKSPEEKELRVSLQPNSGVHMVSSPDGQMIEVIDPSQRPMAGSFNYNFGGDQSALLDTFTTPLRIPVEFNRENQNSLEQLGQAQQPIDLNLENSFSEGEYDRPSVKVPKLPIGSQTTKQLEKYNRKLETRSKKKKKAMNSLIDEREKSNYDPVGSDRSEGGPRKKRSRSKETQGTPQFDPNINILDYVDDYNYVFPKTTKTTKVKPFKVHQKNDLFEHDPKYQKLRANLKKRQVLLKQPEVSTLEMIGMKENKFIKKPRSYLLRSPQRIKGASYVGVVPPSRQEFKSQLGIVGPKHLYMSSGKKSLHEQEEAEIKPLGLAKPRGTAQKPPMSGMKPLSQAQSLKKLKQINSFQNLNLQKIKSIQELETSHRMKMVHAEINYKKSHRKPSWDVKGMSRMTPAVGGILPVIEERSSNRRSEVRNQKYFIQNYAPASSFGSRVNSQSNRDLQMGMKSLGSRPNSTNL